MLDPSLRSEKTQFDIELKAASVSMQRESRASTVISRENEKVTDPLLIVCTIENEDYLASRLPLYQSNCV